jgi:hypothetical protein
MKKQLLLFLLALLPLVASADKVLIGDIYYNLNKETKQAEVARGPGGHYSGSITIPSSVTYGGIQYKVTRIGDVAFVYCTELTSVVIPYGVTSIGNSAFSMCRGLTSLSIPKSVTSIETDAFMECNSLSSIEIPDGITTIPDDLFWNCYGLTAITIPNSVTSIGNFAFAGCKSLTSIEIPSNVTKIGFNTFSGCSSLVSVIIPNSLKSVASCLFKDCTSLTSITIGSGVTFVESQAFASCKKLSNVYCWTEIIPGKVTDVFKDSNIENSTLHVLPALVEEYKAVEPWKHFKNIVPLEGTPSSIEVLSNNVQIQTLSDGGTITVSCEVNGLPVAVYDANGHLFGETTVKNGKARINTPLKPGSVTIVKIGQESIKVAIR